MVFFGEHYIITDLNRYCETNVNEADNDTMRGYSVPLFRQWRDVTNYIGDREHPGICDWEKQKKQQVYNQIPAIAAAQGIPSQFWNALTSLYQQRNNSCHIKANIADALSIKAYAAQMNSHERYSVEYLSDSVIRALQTSRRAWR
ncbi:unnamed protein product [Rotaria socialis]|uniref:Uncharacterized protein n=1 Tax=Rotaria socialis TaxID=392032 RepID=A0A818YTB3_9BILA|nr:unnamed protein product [Rotaria socialis]CAF4538744.1 unnamed protein product [Rotaria socialis]